MRVLRDVHGRKSLLTCGVLAGDSLPTTGRVAVSDMTAFELAHCRPLVEAGPAQTGNPSTTAAGGHDHVSERPLIRGNLD